MLQDSTTPAQIKLSYNDYVGAAGAIVRKTSHTFIHRDLIDEESERHSVIHHVIIAYIPHPDKKEIAYRVTYLSIPFEWEQALIGELGGTDEFFGKHEVSFCNVAGRIQRLPAELLQMDAVVGSRIYLGLDCLFGRPHADPMVPVNRLLEDIYSTLGLEKLNLVDEVEL